MSSWNCCWWTSFFCPLHPSHSHTGFIIFHSYDLLSFPSIIPFFTHLSADFPSDLQLELFPCVQLDNKLTPSFFLTLHSFPLVVDSSQLTTEFERIFLYLEESAKLVLSQPSYSLVYSWIVFLNSCQPLLLLLMKPNCVLLKVIEQLYWNFVHYCLNLLTHCLLLISRLYLLKILMRINLLLPYMILRLVSALFQLWTSCPTN